MADRSERRGFAPALRGASRRALCHLAGILLALAPAVSARGQAPAAPAPPSTPAHVEARSPEAQTDTARDVLDSLRARSERRLERISLLPDSLRDEAFDQVLEELGGAIENLSAELSNLDLQIEDQTISLRDRAGGGRVRINIPPDIGERISEGISAITASILSELPDTVIIKSRVNERLPRDARRSHESAPVMPPEDEDEAEWTARRVIGGDVVKVLGDVVVESGEEIEGSAVAIFGNVIVKGRVDGGAFAVFGNLDLAETAEVGKEAVAVLGRLERHPRAEVGGTVFALDPGLPHRLGGMRQLLWSGWLALLVKSLMFLTTALLLLVLFAVLPRDRLDAVLGTLCHHPVTCLGQGLLWLFAGHLLLIFLMGILILTLIGIPLALLLGVAYVGVTLMALGVACYQLGARVTAGRPGGPGQKAILALIGLFLLHLPGLCGALLGLVPGWTFVAILFGVLGLTAKLLAFAYGLGALVVSRFGSRPSPPRVPAAAPGPAPAA